MFDLRTALRLDALASGGVGALLLGLAGVREEPLGQPVVLSAVVGAGLIGWAGLVGWISIGASEAFAKEVVIGNLVYVGASVALATAGWVDLTGLGVAFVLAQAGAVVGLTCLQVVALRRERTPVLA